MTCWATMTIVRVRMEIAEKDSTAVSTSARGMFAMRGAVFIRSGGMPAASAVTLRELEGCLPLSGSICWNSSPVTLFFIYHPKRHPHAPARVRVKTSTRRCRGRSRHPSQHCHPRQPLAGRIHDQMAVVLLDHLETRAGQARHVERRHPAAQGLGNPAVPERV